METPLKSSRYRPIYRVDLFTAIMLAGTTLDAWTTWFVVSRRFGFEQNPILVPLVRHSLLWIPAYLLSRPLLVPLIPEKYRLSFCLYFGLAGLLFGSNNLAGILCGRFFLVDTLGYQAPHLVCALVAILVFTWTLWKRDSHATERRQRLITTLSWIGVFGLLELGFFAIGRWLFA